MKLFSRTLSRFYFCLLFVLLVSLFSGCQGSEKADANWVLFSEGLSVNLEEYRDAYAMAQMAYSHNLLQDAGVRKGLHKRVLSDLWEGLFLEVAVREAGFGISEEVLEKAGAEVRAEYPDEVLSQMLAESALSERAWERALRHRIRMEKSAEKILECEIEITPEALRLCFLAHCRSLGKKPEEIPLTEILAEELVSRLRQQESEKIYERWLQRMREKNAVLINDALLHEVFPEIWDLKVGSDEGDGGEMPSPGSVLGEDMNEEVGQL